MLDLLKGGVNAETLPPAQIRRDGGTQMRMGTNDTKVREYATLLLDGTRLPPITVFFDGSAYWLGDGFHRLEAHMAAYRDATVMPHIQCEVRSGTRRDAILHAAGANAAHGLPRTDEDKRRAVDTLLQDDEWKGWADREIARRCHVSPTFVGERRKVVTVHVDSEQRMYTTRHGTTAVMNTGKIGVERTPLNLEETTALIESQIPMGLANREMWLRAHHTTRDYDHAVPPGRALSAPTFVRAWSDIINTADPGKNDSAVIEISVKAEREIRILAKWLIERGWGINYYPMPQPCWVIKGDTKFTFANRSDQAGELAAMQQAKAYEEKQAKLKIAIPIGRALELVWAALNDVGGTPILPNKLRYLRTATMNAYKRYLTDGETVTDEVLIEALVRVGKILAQQSADCRHEQLSPQGQFCLRCGQAARPLVHTEEDETPAPIEDGNDENDDEASAEDQRLFDAKLMLATITHLLNRLDRYGELTGKFLDTLPVRRNLQPMQVELQNLINVLEEQ